MRYLDDLIERPHLGIWQLPVAYAPDGGRTYTLQELVDSNLSFKPADAVTWQGWRELTLMQLRSGIATEARGGPTYQLACPEGFVRDSKQGVEEIENNTPLGQRIVGEERRYLTELLADITE